MAHFKHHADFVSLGTNTIYSRRKILRCLGLASAMPMINPLLAQTRSENPVLPLNTPGLDHLDIIVPDVEASSRFYLALFNTKLYAQPFRGGFRYFVLLGEMNENREVGYLAIGDSNGRGTYIGHFCTTVEQWRNDNSAIWEAMSEQIADHNLGVFPGASGFGGIFNDPDGIEIQFLPAPDTLVTAAAPSDLTPHNMGPVTPLGVDHVVLNVSNLEHALEYYRILYGEESKQEDARASFVFPTSNTRLILQEIPYTYENKPGIASYGIKTQSFDFQLVANHLAGLGATVLPKLSTSSALRFIDPDGISVELNPV